MTRKGVPMKAKSFKELFEKAKERETYLSASIILEFTEGLYDLMQNNNISRKELAERLGTSPAYVTKVLRGDVNFTIDSMVRLAKAVGGTIQVHIGPEQVQWFGVVKRKKEPIPDWSQYTQAEVKTYSNKDTDNGTTTLAA
jgi:transcriptional regulator with XRE-family HTH domain